MNAPKVAALPVAAAPGERTRVFRQDRFLGRARALFFARLAFLVLGLAVIGLPSWSAALGTGGRTAVAVYLGMVAYSAANYLLLAHPALGKPVTFVTLCLDLSALVLLAGATGGLRSPLLAAQLFFAILFVVLFPTPLSIVPPLLAFPAVAKVHEVLFGHPAASGDLYVLLWYSAINCILVYVIVYLNERDRQKHRELTRLSATVRDLAIAEERSRLAREIHDGLGGVLSSVLIQSEYLLNMIDGSEVRARLSGNIEVRAAVLPTIRKELSDLHQGAEDSIDELRRSLRMMQEDFDLAETLADYCRVASARHRLEVRFSQAGTARPVTPERALALFRVLQEAIANVARHCGRGTAVDVDLAFEEGTVVLRIRDHGPGFAVPDDPQELARQGHYGLANMRERAKKVSGDFRMTSSPGQGTCVEFRVHAGEEPDR